MNARPATMLGPALVLALVLAGASWWVANDELAGGYEVSDHLLLAQGAAIGWERGDGWWPWLVENRREYTRSTFLHMVYGPLLLGRKATPRSVALVSLISGGLALLVLMLATWSLGRTLDDDETAAWSAALIVLLPAMWGTSRKFGVDLSLAAAVTALAALCALPGAWNTARRALGLGLFAGVCGLVKGQCLFWLPWIVAPTLLAAEGDWRARLGRLVVFGAGFGAGSAPLWLGEASEIVAIAAHHVHSGANPTDATGTGGVVDGLWFYVHGSWRWVGPPAVLAFGLGCLALLRERTAPRLLVVWLIGGLLWHGLMQVRWMRFFLPAFPPLVLLGVIGLRKLPASRAVLGALLLGLALLCGLGSTRWLHDWVDPQICHPPRAGRWNEVVDRLALSVERAPAAIGIDAPDFQADDYRMLELFLRAHWPNAYVFRRLESDGPEVVREYAVERRDGLGLEVFVGKSPPPTEGCVRVTAGELRHRGFGLDATRPVVALVRLR